MHFGLHRGPYCDSHPVGRTLAYTLSDGTEVEGRVTESGADSATVKVTHLGESVSFQVRQEPSWICGYVGTARWDAGGHGWLDPQEFIGKRLEKAGDAPAAEGKDRP